jgi:hypothetical protein
LGVLISRVLERLFLWSFLGSSLVLPWFLDRENLGRCNGRES